MPDSGIVNRNKNILDEARKNLEVLNLIEIRCLDNEDEVMNRLVEMELRDWDLFEKHHDQEEEA